MNWFRLYHEFIDDPKVLALSDRTQLFLVKIFCVSAKQKERGTLPDLKSIGIMTRTSEAKTEIMVGELKAAGFIDEDATTKALTVHGWHARQYNSDNVTSRVKRHREKRSEQPVKRFGNVPSNVSETAPEAETDSDTENRGRKQQHAAEKSGESKTLPFRAERYLKGRTDEDRSQFASTIRILEGNPQTRAIADALKLNADTAKVGPLECWQLLQAARVVQREGKEKSWRFFLGCATNATWEEFTASSQKPRDEERDPAVMPSQTREMKFHRKPAKAAVAS